MGSIGCFGNVDLSNVKVFGTAAFSKSDLSGDITLSAKIIPVWAFEEVDLDTVTLTNSCKKIESYAFLGSNIKKLYLPDSLTKIDINAFIDATVNIYCSHALYNSLLKSKGLARGSTIEIIFTD